MLSEIENNEQISTYPIDTTVTNRRALGLLNAVIIRLSVPDNVQISNDDDKERLLIALRMELV